ncbi:FtsX-like permease family protein [Parabacteroides sp. OttesenSCG-928-G07]|nr:FtsX-like permease family protein [Parabacteroides sp. OttesenSCG-928-G21]MDL2278797.1 FtsX-like permease family protein [Parabacteroides sp. OttesenSCG-928-G07]
MLLQYLKIAIRSIFKDKTYTLINITGLTIAFSCFFLLFFWIRYERSFEDQHPNADRIYMVLDREVRSDQIAKHISIRPTIDRDIKADYPFIEEATSVYFENLSFKLNADNKIHATVASVLPEFFTLFPLECIAGSTYSPNMTTSARYISEDVAIRYFGSAINAVGKTFTLYADEIIIDGVLAVPRNSHIQFELLRVDTDYNRHERRGGVHFILAKSNYKLTETNTYISQKQLEKMSELLSKVREAKRTYEFMPLKDIHLYTDATTQELMMNNVYYGDYKQVRIFSLIAFLILFLAIINYINTSTARALSRSKEVGVRKMAGSDRQQLVVRFLAESFIITLVSVFLAIAVAWLLTPIFSDIMGNDFSFVLDIIAISLAFIICIITSLLSGGYAAFYLSSFNTTSALKGGTGTGSKEGLRKALITVQLMLAIGILVCTVIVFRQMNYIFTKDLGFDRSNIYELHTMLWYESEAYQQTLEQHPYIINSTIASAPPFNVEWGYSGVQWAGSSEAETEITFAMLSCDYRFASTFGLEMVTGEYIQPGYTWWQFTNENSYSIVINETFARLLNMENPIATTITYAPFGDGKTKRDGVIIGVVKDFMFKPMQEGMLPLIINYNPESISKMYIKIRPEKKADTFAFIEEQYNLHRKGSYGEDHPFSIKSLDTVYEQLYHKEVRLERLLSVFSFLSIVLICMGILGIISFMLEKRTKEIALRKINGANVQDIFLLFVKGFGLLTAVAACFALPVAALTMKSWMQQYVYRTDAGWWVYLVVPLTVFLITVGTIFIQVLQAARRNPIESLRSE